MTTVQFILYPDTILHRLEANMDLMKDTNTTSGRKLVWVGPLAVATAILANVLFYYFVTQILQIKLLAPEQFPPPEVSPIPVTDVVLFSFIFGLGAVVVFAMMAQFGQQPIRTYLIISFVVLVLSMFLPLKIPTPPVPMSTKWSLMIMHIIGAIGVVGVLAGLGRK